MQVYTNTFSAHLGPKPNLLHGQEASGNIKQ